MTGRFAALAQRFKAMPKAAQGLVRDMLRHGHDNLQALKKAMLENVASEFDALIADARQRGAKNQAGNTPVDR